MSALLTHCLLLAQVLAAPAAPQSRSYTQLPAGTYMVVPDPGRLLLGIYTQEAEQGLAQHLGIDPAKAIVISSLLPDLPAQAAGLAEWDVIVGIEGTPTATLAELREVLRTKSPGDTIELEVIHHGDRRSVVVPLFPASAPPPESVDDPDVTRDELAERTDIGQDASSSAWLALVPPGAREGSLGADLAPEDFARLAALDEERARLEARRKELEVDLRVLKDARAALKAGESAHAPLGLAMQDLSEELKTLSARLQVLESERTRYQAIQRMLDARRLSVTEFGGRHGQLLRSESGATYFYPFGTVAEPVAGGTELKGMVERLDRLEAGLDRVERLLERLLERESARPHASKEAVESPAGR